MRDGCRPTAKATPHASRWRIPPPARTTPWRPAARPPTGSGALLAAADEETYRAVVTALADARTSERRRVVVSYLVPTEAEWVDECVAEPGEAGRRDTIVGDMLLCSLGSAEQLAALGSLPAVGWTPTTLATVAEGVGPAASSLIVDFLDRPHRYSYYGDTRAMAAALVEFPTDEAFRTLLSHPDDKYVRPSLLKAMNRYPERAMRLLAQDADGSGSNTEGEGVRRLLVMHAGAHPEIAAALLPRMGEAAAELVRPLVERADRVPDAPVEALPALLTSPRWLNRKKPAEPVVVAGPAVEAERVRDAAGTPALVSAAYDPLCPGALDALAEALRDGGVRYVSGALRRSAGRVVVDPVAVPGSAGVTVPALADDGPSATPLAPRTWEPSADPLAEALDAALAALADAAHQGLRLLSRGDRARLDDCASGLRRLGLTEAAGLLTAFLAAHARDPAEAVDPWVEAQIRLLVARELQQEAA